MKRLRSETLLRTKGRELKDYFNQLLRFVMLVILVFTLSPKVKAGVVILDAVDKVYYLDSGFHNETVQRTLVGWDSPNKYNSFFVFDLSSLTEQIISVTLRLEAEGYFGLHTSETFTLFSVETSVPTLTTGHSSGAPGIAIFNDLESGDIYGSATVLPSNIGTLVDISLSNEALNNVNSSIGGMFAIGAHLNNINTDLPEHSVSFSSNSGIGINQVLLTTIPEPATVLLLGLGAVMLRRRQYK